MEEQKKEFVEELGALLKKYSINSIENMEYSVQGYDTEIVTITYDNGYTKKIYVTLDSKSAIVKDIINQGGF